MEEFVDKIGFRKFVDKISSLGFIIRNRVYTDRQNERDITSYIGNNDNINIIREGAKYKLSKDIERYHSYGWTSEKSFKSLVLAKVVTYIDSAKEFGHAATKSKMSTILVETKEDKQIEKVQLFEIAELLPNYLSKKSGNTIDVISLYNEEKNCSLKFCLSDIELVYPDIEYLTRGYNTPIDRKKYIGSVVRVIKKDNKVPLDTVGTISNIIKLGAGDYPKKFCEIVTEKKEIFKINESKLKVINNDNKKSTIEEKLKEVKKSRIRFSEPTIFGTGGNTYYSREASQSFENLIQEQATGLSNSENSF